MSKSLAILLMATTLLIDGACWLHNIRVDREAALIEEIAAQAELNRMDLQILGKNLDNLKRETRFVLAELPILHEHFHVCSTWKVKTENHR